MNKWYTALNGNAIDRTLLKPDAQEHISTIENLIAASADYFEVYRQAFVPLQEGKHFTAGTLQKLHDSSHYKIIFDLIQRYYQKLFKPEET